MFGLFSPFGMNPEFEKAQHERIAREREERLAKGGVPWSLDLKWEPHLTVQARTWPTWNLFDVTPTTHQNPNYEANPKCIEVSPSGQFMYTLKRLPRAAALATLNGSKQGDVIFDDEVLIPALHEAKNWDGKPRRENPWMSITPMELITQRPGLRFSKGHTVVAGLGLGWFLMQCRAKKSVTKVTLVEKSQELVDWLLGSGRIMQAAEFPQGTKLAPLDVIVGDAYDVIPKLTADVAIIDIYKGYGGNDFLEDLQGHRGGTLFPAERRCDGIGKIWNWGKAYTKESRW